MKNIPEKNIKLTIRIRWIAIVEIGMAISFLLWETYRYSTLANRNTHILIEFRPFKEETYIPIVVWSIQLFTGLIGLTGLQLKKIFWISSQVTMLLIFFFIIPALLNRPVGILSVVPIISIYSYKEKVIVNDEALQLFKVKPKDIYTSIIIGALGVILLWSSSIFIF